MKSFRPLLSFLLLCVSQTAYFAASAQTTTPATVAPSAQDAVSLYVQTDARENFSDPRLFPGELEQTASLMIERADFPTYTRELWHVQWRQGDPIDLYVILPKQVVKPPIILYLYGYPADTDRFLSDTYCKTVTARGLAAVGFVSALTGQRYHDRPWKQWFMSELPEALGASAHDVQMIIDMLEKRSDLDAHRLGMFGQGSGATIAVLAATADPRIRALDLLDPWGDWPEWLQQSAAVSATDRPAFTSADYLAKVAPLEPVRRLPQLRTPAVRLQQTSFDPNTPPSIQAAIAKSMPPDAEIVRYNSVEDYAERAATGGRILDWLSDKVRHELAASTTH